MRNDMQALWNRLGLITTLAEKKPGIGRTALMKLVYLLQTIKKVPLGYNFMLYYYGPFDADVTTDAAYAQVLGAVEEKVVYYPNGYGYETRVSDYASKLKSMATDFLQTSQPHIKWVLEEFGQRGAADLELISTMIYADQEAQRNKEQYELKEFTRLLLSIKPRFNQDHVEETAQELTKKGLLRAVSIP